MALHLDTIDFLHLLHGDEILLTFHSWSREEKIWVKWWTCLRHAFESPTLELSFFFVLHVSVSDSLVTEV